MSLPIISVTSALPLTLSPSIRPFNILLATLSVCFSHPWLNNSPNTAIAVEEGLPSWNLLTYQNGHLNGLRAKMNAIWPLQESLLRSLGKTWLQLCMHRSTWLYSHSQCKQPSSFSVETFVGITKRGWGVFVGFGLPFFFFFNVLTQNLVYD